MLWASKEGAGPDIAVPKFPVPRTHFLNFFQKSNHTLSFLPQLLSQIISSITVSQSPQTLHNPSVNSSLWRPEEGLLAPSTLRFSRAGRGWMGVARACTH